MAKLSHAERSEISKKAWRKRKREGGKATCAFCGKLIFARGVRMKGKPYHKGCAEAKGAGLKPAQVGKNPRYAIRFTKDGIYLVHGEKVYKQFTSREAKSYAGLKEAKRQADAYAKGKGYIVARIPNTYIYGIFEPARYPYPAQVGKNPNSNNDNLAHFLDDLEKMVGKREFETTAWEWASGEYQSPKIDKLAKKYHITKERFMRYLMSEQNPRKISERKRAPRDAFRYFGAEELNPSIGRRKPSKPTVYYKGYYFVYDSARGTRLIGKKGQTGFIGEVGSVSESKKFVDKIIKEGRTNPKFKFGPTGFRPPAKWFAKMAQGTSASHFGRKLKELTASQKAKVGQIVGGIWAKYTDATRFEILRKYEPSAVRALANPSLGKRAQMLNCPACNGLNPVSRLNVYLRCSSCGAPLRSVRVRHKH